MLEISEAVKSFDDFMSNKCEHDNKEYGADAAQECAQVAAIGHGLLLAFLGACQDLSRIANSIESFVANTQCEVQKPEEE